MGFLPDVRRIVAAVPNRQQTLLFAATMPDDIRVLASEILSDPLTVQIGHSAPAETVSHALYPVPQHLKTELLIALLRSTETTSVLVFTRTKHRAKRLAQQLAQAGFNTSCIQGNLSQNQRQEALDGFRAGTYHILVATDVAARGIDVNGISHVVNYDMPDTTDAYTHRIGRTGRAERTGEAFTLVTGEDAIAIRAVEHILGGRVERRMLAGFDYRATAAERPPSRGLEFREDRPARREFRQGGTGPAPAGGSRGYGRGRPEAVGRPTGASRRPESGRTPIPA
jgi:ATP-dependent RNA helicase RhlE